MEDFPLNKRTEIRLPTVIPKLNGGIMLRSILHLPFKAAQFWTSRTLGRPRVLPINVTVSVTNLCNSRCRTCFIWKLYPTNNDLKDSECSSEEFGRIFESLGKSPYWLTMSGGEPFLRSDLPEICRTAIECCEPGILNIPTNGLLPEKIEADVRHILEGIRDTHLIINLSLDGVGTKHDQIRGVSGNFNTVIETYRLLAALKEDCQNLTVGIHTVVSKFNLESFLETYEFVKDLNPDSYIAEVAEERAELFNLGSSVFSDPSSCAAIMEELRRLAKMDYLSAKRGISKVTQAFRVVYYRIAAQVLLERRQVIPCYGGYASCQISPYGDVWPCCVHGHYMSMGNLRQFDYNFSKVWNSKKADQIRAFIREGRCACPLASAHYTSMMCSPRAIAEVLANLIKSQAS